MTGSYRYTGSTWYRDGGVVKHGDEVSPTPAEMDAFGDVLEPVDEPDDGTVDAMAAQADAVTDDDVDDSDGDDESYECGAEKASGGECSRSVDGPDERCHDHQED